MPAEPAARPADDLRDLAMAAKAWPFDEARKLLARIGRGAPDKGAPGKGLPDKGYVLFETGYGPSGLPHIGTFAEVVRTTMVRQAFQRISDAPTKLFAFSDDMDGLRKVPDNVPNQALLAEHLGKPLTAVPDPFETHESFGAHNNDRLKGFLDSFGFDYEFLSSTECYKAGRFDDALLKVLEVYEKVRNVILPTLGPDRRKTYSPFLPVCPKTGRVLQVPVTGHNLDKGTITYDDEDGATVEVPVTGGHCKLQWKADWAMRWAALDVDYEMSGKDLIDSVRLSGQITKVLGGRPPEGFTYELFLDENGEKISKSRGNGLTVEEWLYCGAAEYQPLFGDVPQSSLALFMYQNPRRAKRLYFDVIPKAIDDNDRFSESYQKQKLAEQLENPVWHVHNGSLHETKVNIRFSELLSITAASHAHDEKILWGFVRRKLHHSSKTPPPHYAERLRYAIAYYEGFLSGTLKYRDPTQHELAGIRDLISELTALSPGCRENTIQNKVYKIGNRYYAKDRLRDWFRAIYEILLGQNSGPKPGSFFKLLGVDEAIGLLVRVVSGQNIANHRAGTTDDLKLGIIERRKHVNERKHRRKTLGYSLSRAAFRISEDGEFSLAIELLQESIEIEEKNPISIQYDHNARLAVLRRQLADYHCRDGNLQCAIDEISKSIFLCRNIIRLKKSKDQFRLSLSLLTAANIHHQSGEINEALLMLDEADAVLSMLGRQNYNRGAHQRTFAASLRRRINAGNYGGKSQPPIVKHL